MRQWWRCLWIWIVAAGLPAAETPRLVDIVSLGGPGFDELADVAVTADGRVIAVGMVANPPEALAAYPVTGHAQPDWTYGQACVIAFDASTRTITQAFQFAPGLLRPTAVVITDHGVYVGGYGSPGLMAVIEATNAASDTEASPTLVEPSFTQRDQTLFTPSEHHSEPRRDRMLDQRGVPCVLHFDPALTTLRAATVLEGWQSTWYVPGDIRETWQQRVLLAATANGDVIVAHDGGYNLPDSAAATGFERFYAVPDHLSRLAPDLSERRWHVELHLPATMAALVEQYQDVGPHFGRQRGHPHPLSWRHPFLGNPRITGIAVDAHDRILVVGWSPSRTSAEPWWCPWAIRFDGDGQRQAWQAYTHDPQSGDGNRLANQVSDSAITDVAIASDGAVVLSVIGDGGNTVLMRDPRDHSVQARGRWQGVSMHNFRGRTLFWGGIARLDPDDASLRAGRTLGGRGSRRGSNDAFCPAWTRALASVPDGGIAAVGRQDQGFRFSDDAWSVQDRAGLLLLSDATGSVTFATALPDIDPLAVTWRAGHLMIVGTIRDRTIPQASRAARSVLARDGVIVFARWPVADADDANAGSEDAPAVDVTPTPVEEP